MVFSTSINLIYNFYTQPIAYCSEIQQNVFCPKDNLIFELQSIIIIIISAVLSKN